MKAAKGFFRYKATFPKLHCTSIIQLKFMIGRAFDRNKRHQFLKEISFLAFIEWTYLKISFIPHST